MSLYVLLVLGAAAGGFISGLAGFGTGLFALGFWLQVMSPVEAVSLVLAMAVVSGLQGVYVVRTAMWQRRRRLARFLIPAIFGMPLGVAALSVIDATTLKLVVAGFLILYGGFFSLRASLPTLTRPTPWTDRGIGFAGGVLGGAASLSGALPTMWCSLRPWPKAETRAVLQPYNLFVMAGSALLHAVQGAYTWRSVFFIAIALPVTIIFTQIGIHTFQRLTDGQFRRLLVSAMLVSGVVLIVRELL